MIKLVFKKNELRKAMDNCISSIDKKHSMLILTHVLFKFKGSDCALNATNLETNVISKVTLDEPVNEGAIAVPAKYIYDICSLVKGETIIFKYDEANALLDITAGKSKYTVPCLNPEDFPVIPETTNEFKEIEINRLISSYKKLQFSMTENNVNKAYSGVLIIKTIDENEREFIEMVTTDFHRISVLTLKNFTMNISGIENGLVIPGKNFGEISKIFSDSEKVFISIDDDKIFIKDESVTFISRLFKNEFPKYRAVVGSYAELNSKEFAEINRKELIDSVKRVIALSSEEKIWASKYFFRGSLLEMTATSTFGGNSSDEIVMEKGFSTERNIGINARYVIEVITVLDDINVKMIIEDNQRAMTLIEENDDYFYVHMIMPLRI